MNKSRQTALDIAKFWGHKHIVDLLSNTKGGAKPHFLSDAKEEHENYFGSTFLDRRSDKRPDTNWLRSKHTHASSVYIIFSNLCPLVSLIGTKDSAQEPEIRLCRLQHDDVKEFLSRPDEVSLIFLGVEIQLNKPCSAEQEDGLVAWFALNVENLSTDQFERKFEGCYFLRPPMPALLQLVSTEAGIRVLKIILLHWITFTMAMVPELRGNFLPINSALPSATILCVLDTCCASHDKGQWLIGKQWDLTCNLFMAQLLA